MNVARFFFINVGTTSNYLGVDVTGRTVENLLRFFVEFKSFSFV